MRISKLASQKSRGSTTKGLYFRSAFDRFVETAGYGKVLDLCKKLGISEKAGILEDFPLSTLNLFMDEGIKVFWPGISIEDGMTRQGEAAFNKFGDTLLGKTALNLFGSDPRRLAPRVPTYYSKANSSGYVEYVEIDKNNYKFEFRQYESYPNWHYGLIRMATLRIEPRANLTLTVHSFEKKPQCSILTDFSIYTRLF